MLAVRKQVLPKDHPHIADAKTNLALTYSKLERYDDALELQEEVLAITEQVLLTTKT